MRGINALWLAILVGTALYFMTGGPPGYFHQIEKPLSVDKMLAKLPKGNAAITAPKEVRQYQGFDVTLRLTTKELAQLMSIMETESTQVATLKGIYGIRISPRMKAELIGEHFIIQEKGPQEQAITLEEDTTWKWRVHSETLGQHTLKARLHTLVKADGQEAPRTIEVAEAIVSVQVSPLEWAQRHWEFIATGLLIPFLAWAFKGLLDKHKKID